MTYGLRVSNMLGPCFEKRHACRYVVLANLFAPFFEPISVN